MTKKEIHDRLFDWWPPTGDQQGNANQFNRLLRDLELDIRAEGRAPEPDDGYPPIRTFADTRWRIARILVEHRDSPVCPSLAALNRDLMAAELDAEPNPDAQPQSPPDNSLDLLAAVLELCGIAAAAGVSAGVMIRALDLTIGAEHVNGI